MFVYSDKIQNFEKYKLKTMYGKFKNHLRERVS